MKKVLTLLMALGLILPVFSGCSLLSTPYTNPSMWVILPGENDEVKPADVFLIAPTVYEGKTNMSMEDEETKAKFAEAVAREIGIYSESCNVYAPYYRQAGLADYEKDAMNLDMFLELAYNDVLAAFTTYVNYYNNGRPVVLAGCGQGADMLLRLLENEGEHEEMGEILVCAYLLGWAVTPDDLEDFPHLKLAQSAEDTGVIVSFNCEAPEIERTLAVPQRTIGINPLSWSTSDQPVDASQHLGAVFVSGDGTIEREIPAFTGAYLDARRGVLKLTDVSAEDYPPRSSLFEPGDFHEYGSQFFYRNLQENVAVRVRAFVASRPAAPQEDPQPGT